MSPISILKREIRYQGFRPTLKKNLKYRNIYKGKRCFIIGNGPSLGNLDLSKLRDEITFSVNSFTATSAYAKVLPKFHILVDSTRFSDDYPVFAKNLKDLANQANPPICVFPVRFKEYVERKHIDDNLELIYIFPEAKPRPFEKIDFTKKIPFFQNVVNVAIYTAIYLGFTEIILVGCDMTSVIKTYNEEEGISYAGHFYEKDYSEEIEVMKQLHEQRSNEFLLKAYGTVFELFRYTNHYANKNNISIINATPGGALDVFQRVKYESIFK